MTDLLTQAEQALDARDEARVRRGLKGLLRPRSRIFRVLQVPWRLWARIRLLPDHRAYPRLLELFTGLVRVGFHETAVSLVPTVDADEALRRAAAEGNATVVAALLPRADAGSRLLALQAAADHGHGPAVECLLAGIDAADRTPDRLARVLQDAAVAGHTAVVERLLEVGVPANLPDILVAALAARQEATSFRLLDALAPMADATDALSKAAHAGWVVAVSRLLPQANARAHRSLPMLLAAYDGHDAVVALLAPHSAPLEAWDQALAAYTSRERSTQAVPGRPHSAPTRETRALEILSPHVPYAAVLALVAAVPDAAYWPRVASVMLRHDLEQDLPASPPAARLRL